MAGYSFFDDLKAYPRPEDRSAETQRGALPGVWKPRPMPAPAAADDRAGGRTRLPSLQPNRQPEKEARIALPTRDRSSSDRAAPVRPDPHRGASRLSSRCGICIWFGGEGETGFPAEWPEVGEARVELISFLTETAERVSDRWVIGQLVYYLIENRDVDGATRVATDCGIPEVWWCAALRGYILHLTADYVASEAAFLEALASMPPDERERWMSPRFVLTEGGVELFAGMDPAERDRLWELFWRLSDPLFLIEGNDRLTDHFARMVEAVNWQEAANPMGLPWDEDMEATLIRYGRNIGYSRTYDPIAAFRTLGDTRRVVGHHHPKSRGYLFPEMFLESPSDVRYSPDMRPLETQVGRFRRGEMMLVVGAYRPVPPEADTVVTEADSVAAEAPESDTQQSGEFGIQGEPHAALFLIPEDGSEPTFVRGFDEEGVLTINSPPGRYVSGLEVVDLEGKQAWRARQGVAQLPLVPGLVGVSDLLILKEGTPLPGSLEEAIPHVRPGVRIRKGERFPVVWEAYGLRINEPVRVTLGFTSGRPGFLTRVGEFLGVFEPDRPVEVIFEDRGPDSVQTAFRSIEFQLPDLDPGEYTLHLKLELAGREPVVTSRPIIVE